MVVGSESSVGYFSYFSHNRSTCLWCSRNVPHVSHLQAKWHASNPVTAETHHHPHLRAFTLKLPPSLPPWRYWKDLAAIITLGNLSSLSVWLHVLCTYGIDVKGLFFCLKPKKSFDSVWWPFLGIVSQFLCYKKPHTKQKPLFWRSQEILTFDIVLV